MNQEVEATYLVFFVSKLMDPANPSISILTMVTLAAQARVCPTHVPWHGGAARDDHRSSKSTRVACSGGGARRKDEFLSPRGML